MNSDILNLLLERDAALQTFLHLDREAHAAILKLNNTGVEYSNVSGGIPWDYPHNHSWADKCIYVLKEANGEKLTAQMVTDRLIKYHVGVWQHHAIEQTLQGLRKFPRNGFKSEMIQNRRVYWVDPEHTFDTRRNENPEVFSVLNKCHLPAPYQDRLLALVRLNTGSRAIRILHLNGEVDEMPREVKQLLRDINSSLQLGLAVKHSDSGTDVNVVVLGTQILNALQKSAGTDSENADR